MKTQLLAVCLFFSLRGNTPEPHITKEYSPVREKVEPDLFEDAVRLIKKYEGWHYARDHPYVGYGHRLLPTDTFGSDISESFADSLLRSDLKRNVSYSDTLAPILYCLEYSLSMLEKTECFAVNW